MRESSQRKERDERREVLSPERKAELIRLGGIQSTRSRERERVESMCCQKNVTGAVPRVGPVRLHTKSARQVTGIKTVFLLVSTLGEYRTKSDGIYTTTMPRPSD